MEISRSEAEKLIEPHHHDSLMDKNKVININAKSLLTSNRLDLAFKLVYLDEMSNNDEYSDSIYKSHIKAFSLGTYSEPGNDNKNNYLAYVKEFENINKSLKESGFNSEKSLIPLSETGRCINGSHRISSAIKNNLDIGAIQLDINDPNYNYDFFISRGVSVSDVEKAVNKFISYSDNTYLAFIWPSAKKNDSMNSIFDNIIYEKDVSFSFNGAHNLLSILYKGEKWIGSREDDFKGIIGKQIECFPTYDPVKIIAFQAESLDKVLEIKERFRQQFNIGKHSIHITDTKDEAVEIASLVFNKNGVHFLNKAKPNNYCETYEAIERFKLYLMKYNIPKKDVVIDSGMVLSLYGIRTSNDIDFICRDGVVCPSEIDIESHDSEIKYHRQSKEDLIYNPDFYFEFMGLKFISFEQLFEMKINRGEAKDIVDCNSMRDMLSKNKRKVLIDKLTQYSSYYKVKARYNFIALLKKMKLFDVVYLIYKAIRK